MTTYHKTIFSFSFLFLIAYVHWPTVGQIELATCAPKSLIAMVSEAVYGKMFWRTQLKMFTRARTYDEDPMQRAACKAIIDAKLGQ
jgi:hypothetical protein